MPWATRIRLTLSTLSRFQKLLFLGSLFVLGIVVLSPSLDFQPWLATGDHGRDLYCFQKTSEGKLPYHDYWWEYGPLMPYYYGLFFKVFGVSIQSVLLGKFILVFLAGVFVYLTLSLVISPAISSIAALWFWTFHPDFFYTYNHIGGILFLVFSFYWLTRYIVDAKTRYIYFGLAGVFFLNLIRLNIGIAVLAAFLLSLFIIDRTRENLGGDKKKFFYVVLFLIMTAIVAFVYLFFVKGISAAAFYQCFPFRPSYRPDRLSPLAAIETFGRLVLFNFTATWPRRIFGIIFVLAGINGILSFSRDQPDKRYAAIIRLFFISLFLFSAATFHEYLLSGSLFRVSWVFPTGFLFLLATIGIGIKKLPGTIKTVIVAFMALVFIRSSLSNYEIAQFYRKPQNLFQYGKTKIFIANSPRWRETRNNEENLTSTNEWIKTVSRVADFLKQHVGKDEYFLALPYDPLYYFLTEKDAPIYPLAIYGYINISSEEERNILQRLEEKNVIFVVLSNAALSTDSKTGIFGTNYCPLIARYISDHFEIIATYGNWQRSYGFAWDYAVKILKKKKNGN